MSTQITEKAIRPSSSRSSVMMRMSIVEARFGRRSLAKVTGPFTIVHTVVGALCVGCGKRLLHTATFATMFRLLLLLLTAAAFSPASAQSLLPYVDHWDSLKTVKRSEGLFVNGREWGEWKFYDRQGKPPKWLSSSPVNGMDM